MHEASANREPMRPNLTRLRWVGVAIPIAAVLLGETFRYLVPGGTSDLVVHMAWGGVAIAGVVLFATTMFWSIGRAEREILRQNRELAAVNAVATAVQDQQSSHDAITAALGSVVETTQASSARLSIFAGEDGLSPGAIEYNAAPGLARRPGSRPLELPLATGSAVVGLLQIWLPDGATTNGLSTATLQNISHQLGCAIQMRRLVDDLERRQREAAALYDVAVQVSEQHSLADTLAYVTRAMRDLLAADEVAICLTRSASEAVVPLGPAFDNGTAAKVPWAGDGTVCVTLSADGLRPSHEDRVVCPVRATPDIRHALEIPLRGGESGLGDIWAGRHSDHPFDAADRQLLTGLADLTSIAITSARLRERDRLMATVAERERIARELHDSVAQVLGVTHLRLRAAGDHPAVRGAPEIAEELSDLAELAQEAFRDVREAILGLREATHVGNGLVPSLAAYLAKFSKQSHINVSLDARLDRDPELGPRSEIQVIRVIQEALANVRKHAGADSAVVRLRDDPTGTTIEIEDDGHGFDVERTLHDHDGGYGLQMMRERIELVGGTLAVESTVARGTRVTARIPTERLEPQHGGPRAAEAATADSAGR